MHGVKRRVLPDEHAVGDFHVRLDVLEHVAATGAEHLLVDKPTLDIAETAHRIEVVLLVVVQRRLFAQASKTG